MSVTLSDLRPTRVAGMSLRDLAARVGATSTANVQVSGVSVDSTDIASGDLFIGVAGANTHGASFARVACDAGAVAVLTDEAGAQIVEATCPGVPVLVVKDPRHVEGDIAAAVYGDPSAHLRVVGVTGTNGKTTTAYLLHAILQRAGVPALLQGTGVQKLGDDAVYTVRTTSEAPVLHRLMALARERGFGGAVLEVSAHAVSLERINAVRFDAVGFTNLQHDHLDYYGDMEHYFRAKAALFHPDHARTGVVCVDDEWGVRLAEEATIPLTTVSTSGRAADALVENVRVDPDTGGTHFVIREGDDTWALFCPLPGLVNVQNSAVAALVARAAGISRAAIADALAHAPQVPGRMEAVTGADPDNDPLVIVDYAHTPEALEAILATARTLTRGRLHLVFGTDGDRDATKRPDVGRAGANGADVVWVTDENPRTEPAHIMREQLLDGIRRVRPDLRDVTVVETCRRDAIREAILAADPTDTVIITGKGAEEAQEISYCMHPFSDQAVARECLEGRDRRRRLTRGSGGAAGV